MDFYTYSYLQTHQQTITVVSYGIILGALLLILYYLLRYLHHRLITRYRDLSIVFLLFTLILLGTQIEQLTYVHKNQWQSSQILPFIEAVAQDRNLSKNQVMVNQTTLNNGMLIRFKGYDYQLQLNNDHNSYTLQRAHIINHKVYVHNQK